MNVIAQLALIFAVCLAGEAAAAALPFPFPASVLSLLFLAALLFSGAVKPKHIQNVSGFLTANMGIFFLPSLVGTLEHAETLKSQLLPFLAVTLLTTPVVYLAAAWTVQLLVRLLGKRGGGQDG